MKCAVCEGPTRVLETRSVHAGLVTRRARYCPACDHTMTTFETLHIGRGRLKEAAGYAASIRAKAQRSQLIVSHIRTGLKQDAIARELGVSPSAVSRLAVKHGLAKRRAARPGEKA